MGHGEYVLHTCLPIFRIYIMLRPSDNHLELLDESVKKYIVHLESDISEYKKQNTLHQSQATQLKSLNTQLQKELLERDERIAYLLLQLKLKNHKLFGTSSEKTAAICGELPIFNEPEATFDELNEKEKQLEPSYRNKKLKGHKEKILKDLPTEMEEVKLPESEQICKCCGNKMHEMGFDEREEIVPVQEYKLRVIREYKYSCRHCEKTALDVRIIKAKGSKPVIEKSYASSELLAYIIGQKYFNASSLYRIERSFALSGVEISRQTMSNWMIYLHKEYFLHFYAYLHKYLLKQTIIQADETSLQVLREEGRDAKKKSYMWVYRTSGKAPAIVLYDYQASRKNDNVLEFLENFSGKYLQSDGFEAYQTAIKKWTKEDANGMVLKDIKLMGCWAHARRKFTDAIEVLPLQERNNPNNLAVAGLQYINELYKIYESPRDNEKNIAKRLETLKEHLENMQDWMNKKEVLSKTHSGRAVQYLRKQWSRLTTFLEDENISLDNNATERAIRLFVLGRKNWLFAVAPSGAKASAAIYSIIQTAQANHLEPIKYIEYLLKNFPNLNLKDENIFEDFLPWNEKIQEQFYSENIKGI